MTTGRRQAAPGWQGLYAAAALDAIRSVASDAKGLLLPRDCRPWWSLADRVGCWVSSNGLLCNRLPWHAYNTQANGMTILHMDDDIKLLFCNQLGTKSTTLNA
mmetsp:Transcript_135909/g.247178  ORF Transcript_135909/g.247178 Transcript_135909/m.247178 type:complete len:103 (+) Transcript_135909:223-531(+)